MLVKYNILDILRKILFRKQFGPFFVSSTFVKSRNWGEEKESDAT